DRLRSVLPPDAFLARLGGDEFAVALPTFRHPGEVLDLADAILRQLGHPFLIGDKRIFVTASIGTAVYPDDGNSPD
ncbi:diguanylate cyclase, partial [Mycobacterium tuberculosis]|nr:diguanylate cyclase [Mycobacterium tuberculosis]